MGYNQVERESEVPWRSAGSIVSGTATATDTSDNEVLAAAGAGLRNYVTTVTVGNESATDTQVNVKSSTTTIYTIHVEAGTTISVEFPTPLVTSANEALNMATADTANPTFLAAAGYKAP